MTSGAGRTVTWTSFGKVATAAKGTTSLAWAYGPEHQRVKQASTTGATTTTYYFGAQGVMFERVQGGALLGSTTYAIVHA